MSTESKNSKPDSATLDMFAQDLDQIRSNTMAKVGQKEADYIRHVILVQRIGEVLGRVLLVLGFLSSIWWIAGVLLLALSKILDNMEIGHNVMHGQYDWMNDPNINGRQFEWDHAADADSWKRYHNHEHHTYTNIIGKDRDFGYGLLRLSDDIPWRPKNRWQFFTFLNLSLLFELGVAYHEVAAERIFMGKPRQSSHLPISREELKRAFFRKIGRQFFKDYLFFPLLCFPVFLPVLLGNFLANLLRNLWTAIVIFCGHFTEEVHTFSIEECENETQGEWYYRQILGSSNFEGSRWLHILSGHLSCQIEHHLFPDVPAVHYPAMGKEVRTVCQKYNIPYNTGSFAMQYLTVIQRILKYSFPLKTESVRS
jgi:fatty acid desaturase